MAIRRYSSCLLLIVNANPRQWLTFDWDTLHVLDGLPILEDEFREVMGDIDDDNREQ